MKVLITRKKVMETNGIVVKVGYCRLQFLLSGKSPYAYTSGIYGWGSDVYDVNGIAISTGYKPFGNVEPPYSFMESFDNKAEKILGERLPYDEKTKAIDSLLKEFTDAIIDKKF
jgi:hypothetical protein